MRKKVGKLLATGLALMSGVSLFAGCGGNRENITADPTTLNVRIFKGGRGTTYMDALKEKFETLYEKEGYKINVLAPRSDLSSTNVYQDVYSNSGVDVYFAENIVARSMVTGEYGQSAADITESVLKQKPIKFDGTEEEKTVSEKIDLSTFEAKIEYNGKYYGIPYASSISGLIVNKKVLDGYNLQLPKTSNELFDTAHAIMKHAKKDFVYPFTYSTSNNMYINGITFAWMAQYDKEEYNQFFSMLNEDGTEMEKESYKVFGTDAVKATMTSLYEYYDYNMAAFGCNAQDYTSAQAQIMRGEAVFYAGGDYFFNEEYNRFPNNRNDIAYIKMPVISALGTKLFGSGTDYNFDDAKCEKVLRAIIDGADENKEAAQIRADLAATYGEIDEKDVLEVCTARGVAKDSSSGSVALISEKSTKKDLAALFLRFCASTDAGTVFAQETNSNSPFALGAHTDSEYGFVSEVSNAYANRYFNRVTTDLKGYRERLDLTIYFPQMSSNYLNSIVADKVPYSTIKRLPWKKIKRSMQTAAEKRVQALVKDAKDNLDAERWAPLW